MDLLQFLEHCADDKTCVFPLQCTKLTSGTQKKVATATIELPRNIMNKDVRDIRKFKLMVVAVDIDEYKKAITDDDITTHNSGDKCPECSEGRIALMSSMIGEACLDSEPYAEGTKEGDNDSCTLEDYISLSILACDHCGHIFTKNIE